MISSWNVQPHCNNIGRSFSVFLLWHFFAFLLIIPYNFVALNEPHTRALLTDFNDMLWACRLSFFLCESIHSLLIKLAARRTCRRRCWCDRLEHLTHTSRQCYCNFKLQPGIFYYPLLYDNNCNEFCRLKRMRKEIRRFKTVPAHTKHRWNVLFWMLCNLFCGFISLSRLIRCLL